MVGVVPSMGEAVPENGTIYTYKVQEDYLPRAVSKVFIPLVGGC